MLINSEKTVKEKTSEQHCCNTNGNFYYNPRDFIYRFEVKYNHTS